MAAKAKTKFDPMVGGTWNMAVIITPSSATSCKIVVCKDLKVEAMRILSKYRPHYLPIGTHFLLRTQDGEIRVGERVVYIGALMTIDQIRLHEVVHVDRTLKNKIHIDDREHGTLRKDGAFEVYLKIVEKRYFDLARSNT